GAIALAGLAFALAVRSRLRFLPAGATTWVVGGFVAAVALTAVVNGHGVVSALGPYTRYEGYVPYLCYGVVLLTVVRVADTSWLVSLTSWLTAILGGVVVYGVLQVVGADPFHWTDDSTHVAFSTLGQENFAAGAVAALLPISIAATYFW